MPCNILDLFSTKALVPKRKTATEYACACPACGGTDRCNIWPDDQDGRGYYWCRQCGVQGDGIQFLRDFSGMSYAEACKTVGVAMPAVRLEPPRLPNGPNQRDKIQEKSDTPPTDPAKSVDRAAWRTKATAFATWAHARIWENRQALDWLAQRGLDAQAVRAYGLGWNPGERDQSGIVRPRASWGLPEQRKPDGKLKNIWLPVGLVIPQLGIHPDGTRYVRRLRIRRPEEERARFLPEQKYFVIPGSEMDSLYLPRREAMRGEQGQYESLHVIVVVESELDALLLHSRAGDIMGVVATMTSTVKKLPPDVFAALTDADCILVALDFDDPDTHGQRAGAEGWLRWQETFPRARRWPVPAGKDPGEAFEKGEDLRLWLLAGIPEGLRYALSVGHVSAHTGKAVGKTPALTPESHNAMPAGSPPAEMEITDYGAGAIALPAPQEAHQPVPPVPPAHQAPAQPTPKEVRRWKGANLPDGIPYTLEYLRGYYAGKAVDDALFIPCPRAEQPWHWLYHRHCRDCSGHHKCMVDFGEC